MLLFIRIVTQLLEGNYSSFNTSHVVIYPLFRLVYRPSFKRFNTSHVVIYQEGLFSFLYVHVGFNTSHVVIYPFLPHQYEANVHVSIHLMLLFILIVNSYSTKTRIVSIHLMLLFIVNGNRKYSLNEAGFNTSHVVIYPCTGRTAG